MHRLRSIIALATLFALPVLAATKTTKDTPPHGREARHGSAQRQGDGCPRSVPRQRSPRRPRSRHARRRDRASSTSPRSSRRTASSRPATTAPTSRTFRSSASPPIATSRRSRSRRTARRSIGPLKFGDQIVGQNQTQTENDTLDSELVFVGHGVVAPEYKWDDYKGLDTRGKTLVMLVDDPPASAQEPDLFKGKARTYYGRWTYKYEIGAAKNAAGVILIHTTPPPATAGTSSRNSWGGENSFMKNKPRRAGAAVRRLDDREDRARALQGGGTGSRCADASRRRRATSSRCRSASSSPATSSARSARSTPRTSWPSLPAAIRSCATKRSSTPRITITSASDTADKSGDTIYNGAHRQRLRLRDPAGDGARLDATMPAPKRCDLLRRRRRRGAGAPRLGVPRRRIRRFPSGRIALGINYDIDPGARPRARREHERHRADDVLSRPRSASPTRSASPSSPIPSRSRATTTAPITSASARSASRRSRSIRGTTSSASRQVSATQWSTDFRANHYHQPSDQFDPNWDWSEAVQMAQLGIWMGWDAANAATMPNWKPGDEFRAARDRATAAAK